ncbi:MAG: hypothetical protein EOM20_21655 [Spartobacteria bacterium]|nr:hypothetical protein [Spartobacteria bacterium]
MAKFGWIAGIVLVAGAVIALAATQGDGDKTYSWRYKMTVEVETPEGVKTGSAVREVTIEEYTPVIVDIPETANLRTKVRGEAVVVDLGERGTLFAIMDYNGAYRVIFDLFKGPPFMTPEGREYYKSLIGTEAVIPPEKYPMYAPLVTFTDMDDPKSVEAVEPGNLEEPFGEGVKLQGITVELTDQPVTWGIEEMLPWLPSRKTMKGYIGSSTEPPYEDPTKTYLDGSEFSLGKHW